MCGIVGFVGRGDTSVLMQMNASQKHRGPDDSGIFSDSTWGVHLAMTRLSIVDISHGHQPMANSEGSIWIVFNGEIVNAPLLRQELERCGVVFRTGHSDTEVLLQLYERYGESMLEKLNGMFAFVIYDKRKKVLFGARDPFGIKPLYYMQFTDGFAFSSELKGLSSLSYFQKKINRQSVYHFLSFQCVPAPETIFEGVYKLTAGETFLFNIEEKKFQKKIYWYPPNGVTWTSEATKCDLDLQKFIREEFKKALGRWMVSDVPIACSLSGGVDSAIIAGLMAELGNRPIKTYTLGFDDFPDLDERNLARAVSNKWGTQHQEIIIQSKDLLDDLDLMVTALDEPYAGGLPAWFVFKRMAGEVKVCMTGTGGDELFGNYGKWRVYADLSAAIRQVLGQLRRDSRWISDFLRFPRGSRYHLYFREYQKNDLLHPDFATGCLESEALVELLWEKGKPPTVLDAPRIIDMKIQLPEEFLHMTDRFSMNFSIEARPPFLDRDFVEAMMSVDSNIRVRRSNFKEKLIKAFSTYIPEEIKLGKKRGFTLPIGEWIRKQLRNRIEYFFNPSYVREQGIFNENIYGDFFLPHVQGRVDFSSQIWTIFMFQVWYERNIRVSDGK
jgi:asparagine synthase (glutamine-hydrolysing)